MSGSGEGRRRRLAGESSDEGGGGGGGGQREGLRKSEPFIVVPNSYMWACLSLPGHVLSAGRPELYNHLHYYLSVCECTYVQNYKSSCLYVYIQV